MDVFAVMTVRWRKSVAALEERKKEAKAFLQTNLKCNRVNIFLYLWEREQNHWLTNVHYLNLKFSVGILISRTIPMTFFSFQF